MMNPLMPELRIACYIHYREQFGYTVLRGITIPMQTVPTGLNVPAAKPLGSAECGVRSVVP